MDIVASFPADAGTAEAVQPGDRALDDGTEDAQARGVFDPSFGDHRANAALPEQTTVLVGHRRKLVHQGQQLRDVVAGSAGQLHRERDALAVGDDVVLAARPCSVGRAGAVFRPRRAARTCKESITARDQSSWFSTAASPAAPRATRPRHRPRSRPPGAASRSFPSRSPTPGAGTPIGYRCSTNKMPHRACRFGTRGLPCTSLGPGSGSNGSVSDHGSSDTIHGRD